MYRQIFSRATVCHTRSENFVRKSFLLLPIRLLRRFERIVRRNEGGEYGPDTRVRSKYITGRLFSQEIQRSLEVGEVEIRCVTHDNAS